MRHCLLFSMSLRERYYLRPTFYWRRILVFIVRLLLKPGIESNPGHEIRRKLQIKKGLINA